MFLTQFISSKRSQKPTTHLLTFKQGNKEPLKDYITCFNEEALLVEDKDDKMALSTMFSGLKEGKFTFSIGKNPPTTLAELKNTPTPRNSLIPGRTSKGQRLLNWLVYMKTDVENRDKRKYCWFHRDHGHNTSNCVDLKDKIDTLIRKGHLHWYTKEERARKADFQSSNPKHYVHLAERLRKELHVNPCSLTFTEDDAQGIHHPHDDDLVVAMTIANYKVFRILVDTGSSADIIDSEVFERIGIDRSCLRPMKTPLHGFAGDKVVNVPLVHNVILSRPSLDAMRAVVSTYHLMMKFPIEGGVKYLRGDQREAQRCYVKDIRKGSVKQALTINVLDPTEDSPEDLETFPLEKADPNKTVQLESSLNFEQRSQMITFLQQYRDIFVWSHEDMPSISLEVMVHKLNVDPDHKPIKQKRSIRC
ncbi:uncharacterized protein LOC131255046 [Magnolia sinica]|uniref:uncharacterized protein LOC131255046 n=1 Tax=Magnolia sinica TaxID=86752 RepID=UPI0026580388|nr:uncharacterized protein LOC131255046 [Magnolia sinica]